MPPVVIGITGGIASGKTTVASMLADMGARVYDADADCHRLLETEEIAARVADSLGPDVLRDGRLDRRAIARVVFDDRNALATLEGILHAEVCENTRRIIEGMGDGEVLVIDAPLLIEAGMDGLCDVILHVDAPPGERRQRMADRGWDEAEMGRREARQVSVDGKRDRADARIDNSGDPAATRAQVERFWREVVEPFLR
ncbi:MAG: dephospho-CoA kinase [Thermoplasmata archaeon]|nr:dephospho-CoA kinase [Thermoplasmata archaeon]